MAGSSLTAGLLFKYLRIAKTLTLLAGAKLVLTDADSLKVGGVIVPQIELVETTLPLNGHVINQHVFVAKRAWQVIGFTEVHSTAGTDGGAVTLNLEKLTGTTAPGSGTALLTDNSNAGVSLKAVANTVQDGTLTGTTANLQLAVGDRLGLKVAGVTTAVAGVLTVIRLQAI